MGEGDSTNIEGAGSVANKWGLTPKPTEKAKIEIGSSRGHSLKKENAQSNVTTVGTTALKNQLIDADNKLQLFEEIFKTVKITKQLEKSHPAADTDQKLYEEAKRDVQIAKKELKTSKDNYKKALNEHMNEAKKELETCKKILEVSNINYKLASGEDDSKGKEKTLAKLSFQVRDAQSDYKKAQKKLDAIKKEYELTLPKSILKKASKPLIKESKAKTDQGEESYLDEQIAQGEKNAKMNLNYVEPDLKPIHEGRRELRTGLATKEKLLGEIQGLQHELYDYENGLKGDSKTTARMQNDIRAIKSEIVELRAQIHKIDSQKEKHLKNVDDLWKKESAQPLPKKSGKGISFNRVNERNVDGTITEEPFNDLPKKPNL